MDAVTYSLREKENASDKYYSEVSVFTDEVLLEAKKLLGEVLEGFGEFIGSSGWERLRSEEEYILELLMLGVFWKVYSGDAFGLEEMPGQLLSELADIRRKGGYLKPGADFLRGILATLFLSPDLYDNMEILEPEIEHMDQLMNWLDAAGEFKHELKRLETWRKYFSTISKNQVQDSIATCITLAAWFELRSKEVLGKYTFNVEHYLNEVRPKRHYWREDVIFCGRRRVEYHLNMVGAEIMNRAFRKDFIKCSRKAVFLPGCMRSLPGNSCRAVRDTVGFLCARCSERCRVRALTEEGEKYGFEVVIIPHESNIGSKNLDKNTDLGVVGVSCVLNLISGGLMLKEMGIPAQCVLLDFCGCKNHWHDKGITTDINMGELRRILDI